MSTTDTGCFTGGARKLSSDTGLSLLGRLPFDTKLGRAAERGVALAEVLVCRCNTHKGAFDLLLIAGSEPRADWCCRYSSKGSLLVSKAETVMMEANQRLLRQRYLSCPTKLASQSSCANVTRGNLMHTYRVDGTGRSADGVPRSICGHSRVVRFNPNLLPSCRTACANNTATLDLLFKQSDISFCFGVCFCNSQGARICPCCAGTASTRSCYSKGKGKD